MIQRDLGDGTYASYDEDVPPPVRLTEEQLQAAKEELECREEAQKQRWHDDYVRKQREADERFWAKMREQYPDLSQDTMYDIYSQVREFYE